MDIQQKKNSSSTWAQKLLEAVSKNFAHKEFRCDAYFEDGENNAKVMFYQIAVERFGQVEANAEFSKLWPSHTPENLLVKSHRAIEDSRWQVKKGLILNYLKIK